VAGLINDLVEKMGDMAEQMEKLTEIAAAKRDIIVTNDVEKLKLVTAHENTHVGRYQKAEKASGLILDDIAMVLNQDRNGLTLGRLGEIIKEQDDYPAFLSAYERLKQAAEVLKERNDSNNILIESALEYIDYTVNALRSAYEADNEGGGNVVDSKN
jgi:hypothetical protein